MLKNRLQCTVPHAPHILLLCSFASSACCVSVNTLLCMQQENEFQDMQPEHAEPIAADQYPLWPQLNTAYAPAKQSLETCLKTPKSAAATEAVLDAMFCDQLMAGVDSLPLSETCSDASSKRKDGQCVTQIQVNPLP